MYTIDDNGNILDDNGEILEDLDIADDYYTQKDEGLEEQPDSFYESNSIKNTSVDSSYSDLKTNQQVFNEARELLIKKYNEILDNGEMTNDDAQEIQILKENINFSYNTIMDIIDIKTKVNNKYEIIKNKSDIDRNELINILTDNGQNTFLYKDNDGNILLDGAQMPEMNTVKQTVDAQNGVIEDLVSIAYVGDNEEDKKTLKTVYSDLKQTVDGFDQKIAEINKTEGSMQTTINSIQDTVDKHTQTISQLQTSDSNLKSQYYLSTSTAELTGGEWVDHLPTAEEQQDKYIWIRTISTGADSSVTVITEPICISAQDGTDGEPGKDGTDGAPGKDGADGNNAYVHIKYSDDGITFTSNNGKTSGTYMGIYSDSNVTDSSTFSDYKWYKIKGDKGATGQSLVSNTPQYYASTSNTTQTGGSWSSTMPTITDNTYLWVRYELVWANPTKTTYTTPVLEKITDYAQSISKKESKLEQDLDGFKTTVSNTYGTKEDVTTALQTAEKFDWLVKNGGTSTSFSITNGLIKAISESDIELSAKKILINGLLAGTGWSVDEEGNLDINDLNIRGDITCDGANFTSINCPSIEHCLCNDATITTNRSGATVSVNGNNLVGSSIMECLGCIPNNLGGYSLTITLKNDVNENIEIGGFYNGYVIFNFGKYKTTGNLFISYNNAKIQLNNVTVMPYCGVKAPDNDNYWYAILLQDAPNVDINGANIYGDSSNTNKAGIGLYSKSNLTMSNINFYKCKNHVRNKELSKLYCASSTGLSSSYSWAGFSGSLTFLYPSTQAGGQGSGTYPDKIAYNNAQIYYNNVEFCNSANSGNNTTTSNDTTAENNTSTSVKTLSCSPSYADTYRHTVYNNWKKDGVARQGDYGYGDCEGFFFYGSQFATVKGKTITKVEITLKRNSNAGYNTSVSHRVTYHGYTARTSSEPSGTQTGETISLAYGESRTVTITNSTVLNGIKNGTIKGFGIKSTYDKAHYSSVSNGQVKIYYKE